MNDPTMPDHAAPPLKTDGVSPKMIAATAAATVIGVVVALLNSLQENPTLLGTMPTWLQALVLIVIPPVLAGITAFQAPPGNVVPKTEE